MKSCSGSSILYDLNGTVKCPFTLTDSTLYAIDAAGAVSTPADCSTGSKVPVEYAFATSLTLMLCEAVSSA